MREIYLQNQEFIAVITPGKYDLYIYAVCVCVCV